MSDHQIRATEVEGGLDGVTLTSASGLEMTVVPGVGMLGSSLRHHGEELLGTGDGIEAYARRHRWMGIPLLHPWANRLSSDRVNLGGGRVTLPPRAPVLARLPPDGGLPIHGLMAGCDGFRVTRKEADATSALLTATIDWDARDRGRFSLFPIAHRLTVTYELAGTSVRVTTTIENLDREPLPVAFGWHPYFRMPGVPRGDWQVALPVRRHEALDENCLPTGQGADQPAEAFTLGRRTFDDLYSGIATGAAFVLAGGGRRLQMTFDRGYQVAVVYAPLRTDVVCFEPMTAPTDPFNRPRPVPDVAPGGTFDAAFVLTIDGDP